MAEDLELAGLARELLARAEASTQEEWAAGTVPLPAAPGAHEAPGAQGTVPLPAAPGAHEAPGAQITVPLPGEPIGDCPGSPPSPREGAAPQPAASASTLDSVAERVRSCTLCRLGKQRLHAVPGVGSPGARVMLVGEGPGFDEDHKGEPFVGKAGALLDKILESIGLSRSKVYITNMVKCHPMADPSDPEKRGNDRPPEPDELEACRAYLDEQLRIVGPRVIVALGAVAGKALCGTQRGITALRGRWHEYRGIPVLPTFHPAALLRNPELKRDVWTDMKDLKRALEEGS